MLPMSDSTVQLPFQVIAPNLAIGAPRPAGWRAIHEFPLVILVGVTGVGKSTLLNEMAKQNANPMLLPDRRDLTDQLIISTMQNAEGAPVVPVTDRALRFAYTRRYRELYEGGMAHALNQLWIGPDAPESLIFDGLRGANEVTYAASAMPNARFVMLDAPDRIRLQRLLGRGDAFDRIASSGNGKAHALTFEDLGVPEASAIFDPEDEQVILGWLRDGVVRAEELRAKLQIVVEERRNYDPAATLEALQLHAPDATLYLDTVACGPSAVANQVISWYPL